VEKDFKKAGFTLAEVLISLAIIGVVAALTIPSVIRNYRAMQYETSLKKAYSDLSKAINLMRYDTGIEITKDNIGNQQFRTLFKKYFHVIKDCGVRACYDEAKPPYRNYSNTASAHYPYFDDGNFITKDGMTIFVENPGSLDTMISVDINGYLKAPNRWGMTFSHL
jgi:prepilin-type N-terminal cleavage/methylation domain-containing protein